MHFSCTASCTFTWRPLCKLYSQYMYMDAFVLNAIFIIHIVILCVDTGIHSKTEENRYALYTVYIFARFFEHAMTTLINTYSNTEFSINLQDLHSS